jgi:hypothetical protein
MNKMTLLKKTKFIFIGCGLLIFSGISAQTLKHSYTFETGTVTGTTVTDVAGTALGSPANGTINGSNWEVKNGYFYNHNSLQAAGATMGGYISFDSTTLALNSYSALTIEAYITTSSDQNSPNKWTCLTYFGGAAAGVNSFWFQPEISGANTRATYNNGTTNYTAQGVEAGAKQTHHYVVVLTPSTATVAGSVALYYDGVLAQSTVLAVNTFNTAVSGLRTSKSYLGKGGWTDALFTQPIHEYNIYDGAMDAATVAARYKARNTQLAALTVNTGTLSPVFDANIYNYGVVLPEGTTSLTIGVTTAITSKSVVGATTYDVSADYGTITVKADSLGAVPYFINWRKDVTTPVLTHSYTFTDGTAKDVVGTADGTIMGAGAISNGVFTTSAGTNVSSGTSQYISLPASALGITQYPTVTLEGTVKTSTAVANFLFYIGNQTLQNGTDYLFVHTTDFASSCNINHQPWTGGNTASGTNTADNKAHHIVGVMTTDSLIVYTDGVFKAKTALNNVNRLFNVSSNVAYLGRSGYPGDLNLVGSIGEFNIYKGRLSSATIASRAAAFVKDATLSTLTVSVGSLTFDPATTTYNVNVPNGTTSVTVGATTNKEFATVAGTGTIALNPGGIASLVVTSGDGSTTKTYTVNLIPPVPAISVAQSTLNFDSENTAAQTLTVSGANLTGEISISAPAGITVSPTTLPANSSSASVSVTYDGTTAVSGNITIASTGATSQTVNVTGTSYVGCFTKLYTDKTNLIQDPYLNSLTTFGGWGAKTINTDLAYVYCGFNSGKITGAKAGSIDVDLKGKLRANSLYRVKAMIYSVGGQSQIGVSGIATSGTTLLETKTTTTDAWEVLDFKFNTGATISATPLMYFNNYLATGASTMSYIDNWEIYLIPSVVAAEASVAAMATNVGSADSKTITVSGKGLSGAITLALSGADANQFSLSSYSLPLAADSVASSVVTITYTPTAASLNHVATLTISSTGAIDKVYSLSASAGNTAVRATETSGWSALVVDRKLKVTGVDSFEVYSIQGLKVAQITANSSGKAVFLSQGACIIKTNKGVQKVIVK